MAGVSISIDTAQIDRLFSMLLWNLENLTPVMREIGEIARTQSIEAFENGGFPGHPWEESGRVKKSGGQTLINTSTLKNSINVRTGRDQVRVGTNVKYAAIHQLGGTTGPRTIRPKNKKALFWPGAGHPVKAVRHPGSTIPARPFLPDDRTLDWDEIHVALMRYLLR